MILLPHFRPDPRESQPLALRGVTNVKMGVVFGAHASRPYVINPYMPEIPGLLKGATKIQRDGLLPGGDTANVTFASAFAVTNAVNFSVHVGVTIPDTSEAGCFVKIGDDVVQNGFGVGIGGTTMDNSGNNLIFLYEGVAWKATAVSLGTGYHTISVLRRLDSSTWNLFYYVDGAYSGVIADVGQNLLVNPTAITKIGGYITRVSNCKVHWAYISFPTDQTSSGNDNLLISMLSGFGVPGALGFTPSPIGRRRIYSFAATAPQANPAFLLNLM